MNDYLIVLIFISLISEIQYLSISSSIRVFLLDF